MPRKPIKFNLDFMKKDIFSRFSVKQFDDVIFTITPILDNEPYNVTGMTGKIFVGANNEMFMQDTNITISSNSIVVNLDKNMLSNYGRAYAEIELTDSTGTVTSTSFIFDIDRKVGEGATIPGAIEGFVAKYKKLTEEFKSQFQTYTNELDNRFNTLTSEQQQDSEVIDARKGETSLRTKIDKIDEQFNTIDNYINVLNLNIVVIKNTMSIDIINTKLKNGGTFLFKNGDYLINDTPIEFKSNSTILFEENAIIKKVPTDKQTYWNVSINEVKNVKIYNMNVKGDKDSHLGSTGEWGFGINITASENVHLNDCNISNCWGDGVYIGYLWDIENPAVKTKNIYLNGCQIDNVRRNGISICSGDNIVINKCTISNVFGTSPEACIDIEPEAFFTKNIHLGYVKITDCIFKESRKGISFGLVSTKINGDYHKIHVDNCVYDNCIIPNTVSVLDGGQNGKVHINNCDIYNTKHGLVVFSTAGKVKDSTEFIFSNIMIHSRQELDDYNSYYNSVVLYTTDHTNDGVYGNITFDNIRINEDITQYKNFIYLKDVGSLDGIRIKNCKGNISYNAKSINCDLENYSYKYTGNYSTFIINNLSSYNEFETTDHVMDMRITLQNNALDGIYKFKVLNNGNYNTRILLEENNTFINSYNSLTPQHIKSNVNGSSITIIKKGSKFYIQDLIGVWYDATTSTQIKYDYDV